MPDPVWKATWGYRIVHAYETEGSMFPVCGAVQGSPHLARTLADESHHARCRRCQHVLGSRKSKRLA